MNTRGLVPLLVAVAAVFAGWHYAGWAGVALAVTATVTYVLIHLSKMLQILRRAANRPKGSVGSADALNAKLKPGTPLLKVIGMTGSLGEALTPEGRQPESFRWSDPQGASVTGEFRDGRLVSWRLERGQADTPAP
jgi:hypothetical protein